MGLDMYLCREVYLYNFGKQLPITLKNDNGEVIEITRNDKLTSEIAYWRKANAIHKWFIDTCNNGEEANCTPIYVFREQLEYLIKICKKVMDNKNKANELLPTCSGFFFGSLEYDENYFDDIESTIKQLELILIKYNDSHFYYEASY